MSTEVETPVVAPAVVTEDKKEIIEEEAAKAAEEAKAAAEKKDEEKKPEEADKKAEEKKEKAKKEKKVKEPAAPPPPAVHKKDFEKEVVYLYQFPRCPTLPNISPKCLQLETWLKLHGIKYENINHNGKLRSKRGFLPFVELNGEEISDSDLIVKNLAQKYAKEMDEGLTNEQRNIQHAMVQMVDKHLHGAFLHWASRSAEDMIKGYKLNLQQFTGYKVPNGILNFWFKFQHCRKGLKKAKAAVGTGYSNDEIDAEGKADLKVLSEMLADKEFFFGDEPHSLDLVTFAHLAQIINVESGEETGVKCPLKEYLESDCANLVGLYNRMKDRAWGEHWEEAIGEKLELNPHIPKPDPPKEEEEEKKEEDEKKEEGEKKEAAEESAEKKEAAEESAEKKEEDDNKKEEEKEKEQDVEEKKDEDSKDKETEESDEKKEEEKKE